MTKSRRVRWAGHVAQIGEKKNACRIWVGKPVGRCRWVDSIKMDFREKIVWCGLD
jgi:hypothetical protein